MTESHDNKPKCFDDNVARQIHLYLYAPTHAYSFLSELPKEFQSRLENPQNQNLNMPQILFSSNRLISFLADPTIDPPSHSILHLDL